MKITQDIKPPKKFPKFGKLPGKPSELIRVALEDLKAVEKNPHIEVKMSNWHTEVGGKCAVCFAGAVMHQKLNAEGCASPDDFEDERLALEALDRFRVGGLDEAFDCLDIRLPNHIKDSVYVVPYKTNPTQFKRQMAALATALEQEGY